MPKIIEHLEDTILAEAKRQLEQAGYSALTIRAVAKACGVGIGTVYNYYPSKEALVATYMLSDWKQCIVAIDAVSQYSDQPVTVLRCIYDQLTQFAQRHQALFRDEGACAVFNGSFSRYHSVLRSQLAKPLEKFCESKFTADFIAEALLTWTMSGESFEQIYSIIQKII